MERRSLWLVAASALLLFVAACSGSDGDVATSNPPTSSTSSSSITSSTVVGTATTVAPSTTGSPGGSSVPPSSVVDTTTVNSTTTESPPNQTAEANGWRLTIRRPVAGDDVGADAVICYEVTGTSREAFVALDVRLTVPDSESPVVEARVDIDVGRGGVGVDLSPATPGQYDLVVGLVVEGEVSDDLVVRVADLSLDTGAPPASCE